MREFDDYKPIFRKAVTHYEERLRKLKDESEITDSLQTLKNDILKNADNVKGVLDDFDQRVDGDSLREPTRKILCLALTCYIVDFENMVKSIREKIGNLNIHFEDFEKEIKLAKEARDLFCPTDWKFIIS